MDCVEEEEFAPGFFEEDDLVAEREAGEAGEVFGPFDSHEEETGAGFVDGFSAVVGAVAVRYVVGLGADWAGTAGHPTPGTAPTWGQGWGVVFFIRYVDAFF